MPEIMITGPAGRLEGRYKHAKVPGAPLALILHPNPQRGGTMNNKISYSLFPANIYDFNFLAPCPNEGLVVQGDNDQVVNIESVNKLVDKLKDQRGQDGVDYKIIPGAGHFFNNPGESDLMLKYVSNYIDSINRLQKIAA